MQIAWSQARRDYPVSDKVVVKRVLVSLLGLFVGLIAAAVGGYFALALHGGLDHLNALAMSIVGVGLVAPAGLYGLHLWGHYRLYYELTDQALLLRQGLFKPRQRSLPYAAIRAVRLERSLLNRGFDLVAVRIEGLSDPPGPAFCIDGLEPAAGRGLQAALQLAAQRAGGQP